MNDQQHEEQPLGSEVFSLDQLEHHARLLASRHELGSGRGQGQLLARLTSNEVELTKAYECLSAAVQKKERISPAGEWLLDNYYLIEEQIQIARRHLPKGYSRELPFLTNGPAPGQPRVYAMALEIIAHVDARVDQENITRFVGAYQQVGSLRLGEYWAIPIMLRLALIENLRRVAKRVVVALDERRLANIWADKMLRTAETNPKSMLLVAAELASSGPTMSTAFVAELSRRLHGQSVALEIPLAWIEAQVTEAGMTTAQTVHLEGQQQAANQVSVGASVGSLRLLNAMDWRDFVELMSAVEAELGRDPADTYARMDFATRDKYRHVVESLAKRSGRTELVIAQSAVQLARSHLETSSVSDRKSHVGYYLVDQGLEQLKTFIAQDNKVSWSLNLSQPARLTLYLGSIATMTLLITVLVTLRLMHRDVGHWALLFAAICVAFAASQVAVALVNWVTTAIVKPHLLPRMDFSKGIPEDCRTLVAIPCMLTSTKNVERLVDALEVRYLANRDANLQFALVSDFRDAKTASAPEDDALVEHARQSIDGLNKQYGDVFLLLHRPRLWNASERVWMGFERKRGKLEALNRLLRHAKMDAAECGFSVTAGNLQRLTGTKYVITLDTDSQLPRDVGRELISTIAHPLNRAIYDQAQRRVVAGYGILQPRIAISLPGSRRSLYVRLYAGDAGIDPYTRAVSDIYQDVFREGSFIGKGIYDVDAFIQSLDAAFPENFILSHDLIEGNFARSGLISDIELYEEHPYNFLEDAKRRHRWIRGDWQIMPWLLPWSPFHGGGWRRNLLPLLAKWKIFDNLRRSLVPVATTALLLWGWDYLRDATLLMRVVIAMIFLPPILTSIAEAMRKPSEVVLKSHLRASGRSMMRAMAQSALAVVFLPFEAYMNFDAIVRSLVRMMVTHKHRLEWQSPSEHGSARSLIAFCGAMIIAPLVAVALGVAMHLMHVDSSPFTKVILGLWFVSPGVGYWLSRLKPEQQSRLAPSETLYLHKLSRKTWRFFETFVGPEDNWLPPDNFQEYPTAVIAHRTSPTNIGLAALANLAAYDFGYISVARFIERTTHTFKTMESLERFRGHFYNWYDTISLRPLQPLYVSTVDSGNLAGMLLTLKGGLRELASQRIIPDQITRGLRDTLAVLAESSTVDTNKLRELLAAPLTSLAAASRLHVALVQAAEIFSDTGGDDDVRWWMSSLTKQAHETLNDVLDQLAPWTSLWPVPESVAQLPELGSLLADMDRIPSVTEVAALGQHLLPVLDEVLASPLKQEVARPWLELLRDAVTSACANATEQIRDLERLAVQSEDYATFEYDFLYDKSRHLLTIGYNVSEHRRDASYYDLLASEARLCSFIAVAQGSLPQDHWFALGRLMTTSGGEPTLLSWSGSMFEYLMPLLIMPSIDYTLLGRTYQTAVKRQIEYGNQRGVPWGISESGYNTTDVHLNYQYRAFGVPGLGFKRGLADDLVIAPYATVMALMVAPEEACANLKKMSTLGFEGRYGFYEAIDYTPGRLAADQSHALLKSFMAHHEGMSFLSLAYHLLDKKMQRRFLADPLFQATEPLLHERVPRVTNFYPHAPEVSGATRIPDGRAALMRVISTADTPRPEVHLLSNGRYTVMVTNSGGGYSRWRDVALTRWREDPTCDNWGTFCYVRDVKTGNVWSAAHQPSLKVGPHYEAIFPQARAEFRRRDHDLEMHTEITVSPEDDIELRRYSLTNLSPYKRVIELTSYAEVVLAPQAADVAHPAFSNLFVQTEIVPDKQAILCTRRPRAQTEKTPTMVHLMTVHGATVGQASYETDRASFIGRGRSVANPVAMEQDVLGGHEGSVLDPIVAIRCRIELEPDQTVKIHVVTGIGETRDQALALMGKYHDRHLADRVFELAWTHRQIVLRQLDISEVDAQLYGRLASSIVYANPARRPSRTILVKNRRGQSGLWGYGISGDLPIVLLRIGEEDKVDLVRQLLQAHGLWRSMGLLVDLVIWNEDDSGYRQLLQEQIMGMIARTSDLALVDKPGGIFVRRAEQMSEDDRTLFQTVARAVLMDVGGSLADQIDRRGRPRPALPAFVPSRLPTELPASTTAVEVIASTGSNGLGEFSEDGREYIVTTTGEHRTPMPWSNVIANRYFGSVISDSGSAYTWCENAHEYRITPWHNDPVTDQSGEAFYLRDEETGEYWSPTPLPVRGDNPYVTRHGFGYSVFEHDTAGIKSEMTTFVAVDAPVKITVIKLQNTSGRPRRLTATGYCEWVLGELRANSLMHIVTEVDPTSSALFARNPYNSEFGERIAFFDTSKPARSMTSDRSGFLGRNGRLGSPLAMRQINLSGKVGAALDACAAMQMSIDLAEGETYEVAFVLGVGRDVADVRTLIRRFRGISAAQAALSAVRQYWTRTLGAVQIRTPNKHLDLLSNGWLLYQVLACRVWARSGSYQSGGAFGFRDQLQDTMALLHAEPALLREHILRCAARQYRDGDVQHWWHPPSGRGVRTHFSDDFLWLPLATTRYVLSVGDTGILSERVPFIEGRHVRHDEEAYSDVPVRTDENATLYEHCVRAIKNGFRFGAHGLPLMGCGDWNDGMNLVGEHGKGESVWLAFFQYDILGRFAEVARIFGDDAFAEVCQKHRQTLQLNVEKFAWDGQWYKRAYFDDGTPLGSSSNPECQIDSLPQSWAVLSGMGEPERARQAMEAVSERLVDRSIGIVKLFDPPFDKSDLNPGYIKGYVPGVRENGGQYTHAAIWVAMAFAERGDHRRAWEVMDMINPLNHAQTPEQVATYKVEPYVMAADVYAVQPHTGRGGWTWYTGAAGWTYRLVLESLLGLRLEVDKLFFSPCVPPEWTSFDVQYRYRETTYDIAVKISHSEEQQTRLVIDGEPSSVDYVAMVDDRVPHKVELTILNRTTPAPSKPGAMDLVDSK